MGSTAPVRERLEVMGMPIEKSARQAAAQAMKDSQAADTVGPSLAEQRWLANPPVDLAVEYAEKSGYAYGFIEGLAHKLRATTNMLIECKTSECLKWIIGDLEAMQEACMNQLQDMQ
jgi:hypothetical protein